MADPTRLFRDPADATIELWEQINLLEPEMIGVDTTGSDRIVASSSFCPTLEFSMSNAPTLDFDLECGPILDFALDFCACLDSDPDSDTNPNRPPPGDPPPPPPPAIGSTFTTFALDASAQQIHVSDSGGDDTNDGLTTGTPVKTITQGLSLIRDGMGDHLLLKRGDTWSDFSPYTLDKDGLSTTYPMYIGPYGTGNLPIVRGQFRLASNSTQYLAIQGINMSMLYSDRAAAADAGIGTALSRNDSCLNFKGGAGNAKDIWVEGCRLVGGVMGGQFQKVSNLTFRRNTVLDTYPLENVAQDGKPHSQGIFLNQNGGVMRIEENVFDRCGGTYDNDNIIVDGIDSGVDGSTAGSHRTFFNHGIYFSQGGQPVGQDGEITKNLISRSGLACQHRIGGILSNNVVVRCARALGIGHAKVTNVGVGGTVDANLVMLSENTAQSTTDGSGGWTWDEQPQATGIGFAKIGAPLTVSNNIVCQHANQDATYGPLDSGGNLTNVRAYLFDSTVDTSTRAVTFDNNAVRNWDNPDRKTPAEHPDEIWVLDRSGGTFSITQTNNNFGAGTNTDTDIPAAVWSALAGVSSEATYLTKVRGFQYGSDADVEDAWTADYHATVYAAANAAL